MRLRVCLTQCRPPGQTQDDPPLDSKMRPQRLDVGDEVGGGVDAEIGIRLADQGPAAPAPALVEQHDAVGDRIEQTALTRCAARAGSAVQVERGFALRIAAALPIDLMPVAHVEHPAVVRLKRRESVPHPSLRRSQPDPG